jgi:hypothetical protein
MQPMTTKTRKRRRKLRMIIYHLWEAVGCIKDDSTWGQ